MSGLSSSSRPVFGRSQNSPGPLEGPVRAYGLFSGGLDSLLAVRLLLDQGLTPTLLTFTSPFFDLRPALAGAAQLGLPLVKVDIYEPLLELIKNPPHGLGRRLNPCIDCHALMFKRAGQILAEEGGPGFLFSGEVAGQRPMSQNPRALKTVAETSGQGPRILRPLSARLLPRTEAEEKGWVDREGLLGLSGRGRRPQMDLAEKYGFKIPPPAGGCLLTDEGYCRRFKWLLSRPAPPGAEIWPPARAAEMLKHGRLFVFGSGGWLLVGRNQADNRALQELARPGDRLFRLVSGPGPTVLCPGPSPDPDTLAAGRGLAAAYGDHGGEERVSVRMEEPGGEASEETVAVLTPGHWEPFLLK